jgi:ubiquitin-protein ligase
MKRLSKDFKTLQKSPIPGTSAAPTDNFFIWHGNINVPLTIEGETKDAPLHIKIVVDEEYPSKAPNAGFAIDFPYNMGASYIGRKERDGVLEGMKILCLDILGNFADIHDEWAHQEGSGWSPACSITTVLVSLQALLLDLDGQMSPAERKDLYDRAMKYECQIDEHKHTGSAPYPPLAGVETAKARDDSRGLSEELYREVQQFAKAEKLAEASTARLLALVKRAACGGEAESGPTIDESIVCYCTGASYAEDTLGYGVRVERNMLKTAGELLSFGAFHEDGLRLSSQKAGFTHFIPAWINPTHAAKNKEWIERVRASIEALAPLVGLDAKASKLEMVLAVLPKLINSMVVEINKGDRASAILFFEAMSSFWRTLRWFVTENATIRELAEAKVKAFIADETNRHKDRVPDVGQFLALTTALTDSIGSMEEFIDAYLDENFVRCVMWWQKEVRGEPWRSASGCDDVFRATAVSRNICLFQLTVLREVIGSEPARTAEAMDASNGKIPERLERLQRAWKQREDPKSWRQFAEATGCSQSMLVRMDETTGEWILDCVTRAKQKGSKYGRGSKGGRRGGGGYRGGGWRWWRRWRWLWWWRRLWWWRLGRWQGQGQGQGQGTSMSRRSQIRRACHSIAPPAQPRAPNTISSTATGCIANSKFLHCRCSLLRCAMAMAMTYALPLAATCHLRLHAHTALHHQLAATGNDSALRGGGGGVAPS